MLQPTWYVERLMARKPTARSRAHGGSADLDQFGASGQGNQFSIRERRIMLCMMEELSNEDIARRLKISRAAVDRYVDTLRRTLRAAFASQATSQAAESSENTSRRPRVRSKAAPKKAAAPKRRTRRQA
jgi:DNA-binding CsgD family transcriptional regulator